MGRRSYEVAQGGRGRSLALLALIPVGFLIAEVQSAGRPHQILMLVGPIVVWLGAAVYQTQLQPYRITLSDTGVLFVAKAREGYVPWDDLREVSLRTSRYGKHLVWRTGAKGFKTSGDFDELDHLLVDIEEHAPHVRVTA